MLFLELLLIRWLASEVRVFGYFKNLTLIGCFFGMGLGCLVGAERVRYWWTYPLVALLVVLIIVPGLVGLPLFDSVNRFLAELTDMPLWSWGARTTTVLARLAAIGLLVLVFLLLAAIFAPAGKLLGAEINSCANRLGGYSANVVGSLVGIAAFEVVSYLSLPPPYWFLIALLGGAPFLRGRRAIVVASLSTVLVLALFAAQPKHGQRTVWSPYQKITCEPLRISTPAGQSLEAGFSLLVNQAFHQKALDLRADFIRAHPDVFPEGDRLDWIGYNLAYRFQEHPRDVLVVGAGTGNDVAAALRNGAEHVDAVEIDPGIVALGREIHPERPYDDRRVRVIVDDARSFLKKTHRQYDLVVFGALDSHTLSSALSNLRIDNYVYTVEALREVRARLKPGGIVWLLFAFEKTFIGERLYAMLEEAFGSRPIAFYNEDVKALSPSGGGGTFVIDREGRIEERLRASSALTAIVSRTRMVPHGSVLLATDDWPYLYVRGRAVPQLYLVVMGVLVLVAVVTVRPFVGKFRQLDAHFFLLGAGFLLLEVASISRLALVFGNTWEVNAVVIASILVMILAANLAASFLPTTALPPVYLALAASLLFSYRLPLDALVTLPGPAKLLVAGGVTALPILFSGIVFARTFAGAVGPSVALGSNLLGAIVGGACESASFVIGLNALVVVALAFYTASFLVLFFGGRLRILGRLPASPA